MSVAFTVFPPNTTCDIYRTGNAPPAAPDVAGVQCYLEERGRNIKPTAAFKYSHIMHVAKNVDIRDGYNATQLDSVYIPDKTGTQYVVILATRTGLGTSVDHKVVYLDRQKPTWPSDNV
jgi:hypothetical protein